MMKNLDNALFDLDGKALKDVDGTDASMRVLVARALANVHEDDRSVPAEKKAARGELALRVYAGGDQEYKPEEISQMKEYVGKSYGPLIITQIFKHLDA